MKTWGKNITRLLVATGFIWISLISYGQEVKLTKEQKKELRKKELDASYISLDSLVNSRMFVLAADFLQGRSGERVTVNSTLNFIKVTGETGILQVGSNSGMGYNGLGGVTAEGSIGNWQLDKNDKNRTISLRFGLSSPIGHYDVLVTVSASNNTSATITGMSSGRLTWTGHLESLRTARVFKGRTNF